MSKLKDQNKVFKLLTESKSFMEEHTADFDRNQRLKDGKPKTNIPANYPRVTDKTLSKMINDTPKRVFQKTPDFEVDTGASKFEDIVSEYILNEEFINGEDQGYSFYQKLINTGRDAAGFGMCAVYSPFELVNGSYRIGFVPIYWGDLFLEAYTTGVNASNFHIIRQWKTEQDMQNIADGEDDDASDGWKRDEIRTLIKNHATTPKDYTNVDQIGSSDLYEVFTYISKDEFITFSTAGGDKILRSRDNKSKRKRVVGLYYDFDGDKPLGRSMVDIGGDLQDLIDSDMQAYQFNRALALQPPVVVSGDLDGGDGIYMPNNVLVSDDPSTAVKELSVSTTAIEKYPELYALQKSQLNALIPNASDTTISSAATGGLESSKTPTGIRQNENTQNLSDNFFFKNAEAFLGAWAENGLNIYFHEFKGVIEIQLNNVYANKARAEDPTKVSPTGLVQLDCSVITKIKVKVTSGSTRDVAREEDNQRLAALINMEGQSEAVAAMIGAPATKEIVKSMIKTSGVSNAGDIIEAIDNTPPPEPEQREPIDPSASLNYKDAPDDVRRQIEAAAGLQPSEEDSDAKVKNAQKDRELTIAEQKLQLEAQKHEDDSTLDLIKSAESAKMARKTAASKEAVPAAK